MNAGDLRKLLEGVPDDAPVFAYDSEYGKEPADVDVVTRRTATIRTTWAAGKRRSLVQKIVTATLADLTGLVEGSTVSVYEDKEIPAEVREHDVDIVVTDTFSERLGAETATFQDWEGRTVTRELLSLSEPVVQVEVTQA